MTKVATRIAELKKLIDEHDYLYHVLDQPVIADSEYDQLFQELKSLEESHPQLKDPLSPTQRVGFAPLSKFEKLSHRLPMLSLSNSFSEDDLKDFHQRLVKHLQGENLTW